MKSTNSGSATLLFLTTSLTFCTLITTATLSTAFLITTFCLTLKLRILVRNIAKFASVCSVYALKTISYVGLKKTLFLLILTIVDKKDGSVCVLLFERLPDVLSHGGSLRVT